MHMWQSRVENKHYSVSNVSCEKNVFKVGVIFWHFLTKVVHGLRSYPAHIQQQALPESFRKGLTTTQSGTLQFK